MDSTDEVYNSNNNDLLTISDRGLAEFLQDPSDSSANLCPLPRTDFMSSNTINVTKLDSCSKNILITQLIELVRDRPCLWDVSARSYKEKPKKDEAWRQVATQLRVTG